MHIWHLKYQCFQGSKAGTGPWKIFAHYTYTTSLCYVGLILGFSSGPANPKSTSGGPYVELSKLLK